MPPDVVVVVLQGLDAALTHGFEARKVNDDVDYFRNEHCLQLFRVADVAHDKKGPLARYFFQGVNDSGI